MLCRAASQPPVARYARKRHRQTPDNLGPSHRVFFLTSYQPATHHFIFSFTSSQQLPPQSLLSVVRHLANTYTEPRHPLKFSPNTAANMSKTFTTAEVAQHKTEKDMWLIVEDGVYDITGEFLSSLCCRSLPPSSQHTDHVSQLSNQSTPVVRRSSSASPARTPPRSSGSTTTRRSSRSTAASSRSAPSVRAPSFEILISP